MTKKKTTKQKTTTRGLGKADKEETRKKLLELFSREDEIGDRHPRREIFENLENMRSFRFGLLNRDFERIRDVCKVLYSRGNALMTEVHSLGTILLTSARLSEAKKMKQGKSGAVMDQHLARCISEGIMKDFGSDITTALYALLDFLYENEDEPVRTAARGGRDLVKEIPLQSNLLVAYIAVHSCIAWLQMNTINFTPSVQDILQDPGDEEAWLMYAEYLAESGGVTAVDRISRMLNRYARNKKKVKAKLKKIREMIEKESPVKKKTESYGVIRNASWILKTARPPKFDDLLKSKKFKEPEDAFHVTAYYKEIKDETFRMETSIEIRDMRDKKAGKQIQEKLRELGFNEKTAWILYRMKLHHLSDLTDILTTDDITLPGMSEKKLNKIRQKIRKGIGFADRPPRTDLQRLELPTRLERVLLDAGIRRIDQLRNMDDKQLLEVKGVGATSLTTIRNAVGRYADAEVVEGAELDEEFESLKEVGGNRPEEVFHRLMVRLEPEERRVLYLRYGVEWEEPLGYRKISNIMGISESQCRALNESAMKKLKDPVILNYINEWMTGPFTEWTLSLVPSMSRNAISQKEIKAHLGRRDRNALNLLELLLSEAQK